MSPKRIQRKRTKGWKMPSNTVYVGRPTKWGNPYTEHEYGSRENAVAMYRSDQGATLEIIASIELRGKDLACWCPLDQPCHADVLLEIANGPGAAGEVSRAGTPEDTSSGQTSVAKKGDAERRA